MDSLWSREEGDVAAEAAAMAEEEEEEEDDDDDEEEEERGKQKRSCRSQTKLDCLGIAPGDGREPGEYKKVPR